MRIGMWALVWAALGLGTSACSMTGEGKRSVAERVRWLDDADHDTLLEERRPAGADDEDGGVILPAPDDCPVMQYREEHITTIDADGDVLEETYRVCTQCFDEDGQPLGEEVCDDDPPLPPDVVCEEYPSMDPNQVCFVCYASDGTVIEDSCHEEPVACQSDADCPSGQICYVADAPPPCTGEDQDGDNVPDDGCDPMDPGNGWPPSGGYCAPADPCVPVDSLPSDPTGQSCWICTDPATGEVFAEYCDAHTCDASGGCANPWETCDPATGLCVFADPCQPVPGLPDDPTGSDCYACPDAGGMNGGGWCNVHACSTDADCAPLGETCNEQTNECEWVDPCTPVPGLPEDPTGSDCYVCTDPATGEDWGGHCNAHACQTDADCLNGMYGDTCEGGSCTWSAPNGGGGCDGGGMGGGAPGEGGMQPVAPLRAALYPHR